MTGGVVRQLRIERLTPEAFAPFGEIIGPAPRPPVTNRDLLARNAVRMAHAVPPERLAAFDVLDYWAPVGAISQEPMKFGFLVPRERAWRVDWLERHLKGTQSFLPLGGQGMIVLAPPNDPFDSAAPPRAEDARAFLLDGTRGINLRLGTWHWTPFPMTAGAAFAILVRQDAAADDLNMIDLHAHWGGGLAVERDRLPGQTETQA
ncbi:MAG: ureidoglycolate lyase [Lautropia sp.]